MSSRPLCTLVVSTLIAACTGAPSTPVPTYSDGKADGSKAPACSQAWWDWLNGTYLPLLDRPVDEVSASAVMDEARNQPDPAETPYSYSLCFQSAFDKYVFAPAATRLDQADRAFVDTSSLAFDKLPPYLANIAMTDELRRNAQALQAIQPTTMDRLAHEAWTNAYSTIVGQVIHPLGIPGQDRYYNIVEPEWVIDDAEASYLALIEAGRAKSNQDGGYAAWLDDFEHWLFGPAPLSNSTVFNTNMDYGLEGVEATNGHWVVPAPVRAFLDRYEATRPDAIGSADSAKWMGYYHARILRMFSDASEPFIVEEDDLALKLLEEVRPAVPKGLVPYQTWLDVFAFSDVRADPALLARVMLAKPCVDQKDLAAATDSFTTKSSTIAASADVIATAAPAVCR